MSENIDVLLAELREKNLAKKRRKMLNPEPVTPAAPQKKAKKKKEAVYIRAAARIKAYDHERRKSKVRFNEEDLIEVARRVQEER